MENELIITEDKENEYDPFNPTDSDFEKDENKEKKEATSEITNSNVAIAVAVNEEKNGNIDVDKKKKIEIKSQSPSTSNKNTTTKKHRSSSRSRTTTTSKRSSKHRSKSKSKERKKDVKNHHRSSYKRSPSPHERKRRSRSQTHKHKTKTSTKSRSRSRSINKHSNNLNNNKSSFNHKKRSRTKSPSKNKRISTTNNNNNPLIATSSSTKLEGAKDSKRSNLIQIQTQDESLKSSNNNNNIKKQSKSIADYLIEEMINDEKQVKVDVNNIKLPDYVNSCNNNNSKNKDHDDSPPSLNNQNLNTIEPSPELAKLQAKLLMYNNRNNENKTSDVAIKQIAANNSSIASSSSFASVSGGIENKNNTREIEEDEPYDVEAEYKELDKRLNEFNEKNVLNNNSSLNDSIPIVNKINKKKMQDDIVNAAKQAIKPFYVGKKINKDDYKMIMKKVVNKCLQQLKDNSKIDTNKVSKMIVGYVSKVRKEKKV